MNLILVFPLILSSTHKKTAFSSLLVSYQGQESFRLINSNVSFQSSSVSIQCLGFSGTECFPVYGVLVIKSGVFWVKWDGWSPPPFGTDLLTWPEGPHFDVPCSASSLLASTSLTSFSFIFHLHHSAHTTLASMVSLDHWINAVKSISAFLLLCL